MSYLQQADPEIWSAVRSELQRQRDKIELMPKEPKYVRNVLRRGYMIVGGR